MTWVKLDDRFPQHPKIVRLSDKAFRAYLVALCHAASFASDGAFPREIVGKKELAALTEAGLVDEHDGSLWVHDFLEYNPPRSSREQKKEQARTRMAKARGQKRTGDNPGPVPVPLPEEQEARPTVGNPVTHDQLYLAEQLERAWGRDLQPPAIQKLNNRFGTAAVENAMRSLHGFPPEEAVRDLWSYLESICQEAS